MKKIEGRVRISPGSRVAAMTGHAIPGLERELISRASLIFAVLRNHAR